MTHAIKDLRHEPSAWAGVLDVNNANARETSLLTIEKLGRMIAAARVATFVAPAAAFLIAFEQDDDYDGGHFQWFRRRLETFLYVDRVVVASSHRRLGLGRLLYEDLFKHSERLGHAHIACEVNVQPPNPISDAFHDALGFQEVGRATIEDGTKTVRYLVRRRSDRPHSAASL